MNYTLTDYEDAVLTALDSLSVDSGGYLKVLKGYAGEFDGGVVSEQFIRGFPGVLVEIPEAVYTTANNVFYRQEATVNLYIGARSYRSQNDARGEDTGISRVLYDIRSLLLGKTLGLQIRPLENVREMKVAGDRHTVLFAAQYKITNDRIAEA